MRHKGLSLKISPGPCPQWAHGRHPQLWRYANPGQLSDIAFNLSRAKPSIKLFGIWQLLKGQRGIKHSRTRMKMSSLPHNLLSFNTQDKQSTHTQHTHTHSYIMLSARYIGLFGPPPAPCVLTESMHCPFWADVHSLLGLMHIIQVFVNQGCGCPLHEHPPDFTALLVFALQTVRRLTASRSPPYKTGVVFHIKSLFELTFTTNTVQHCQCKDCTPKKGFFKEVSNESWSAEEKTQNGSRLYHYNRRLQQHIFSTWAN